MGSATDLGGALLGAQVHSGELSGAGRDPLGPATDLTGGTDIADVCVGGGLWKSKERGLGIGQGWEPKAPGAFWGRPLKPMPLTGCVWGGTLFC